MRSASRDRRIAAAALAGLLLSLALFYAKRPAKAPEEALPSAPGDGLAPLPPSVQGKTGEPLGAEPAYTNAQLQQMLQKQTDAMGIDRIVAQEDEDLPEAFLGDRIGTPETRMQAENAIRRLSAMRQAIDAGKPRVVPIDGETVPVLAKTAAGGSALEGAPEGQAAAPAESAAMIHGPDGSWSGSFAPGEEGRTTVRDARTWKQLWPNYSKEPVPEVNFAKQQVAVIFLGVRPTGGYKVRIKDARLTATHLIVSWQETPPAAGKSPPEGQTAPFTMRPVPLTDLPVRFEKTN